MNVFNPIIIIPHYNHSDKIKGVIESLQAFDLPILVVDDGSSETHLNALRELNFARLEIYYRQQNGGKGSAMKTGLTQAYQQGYSHGIQIDADGQHSLQALPLMLAKSKQDLTALICGKPVYSDDAPKSRLYGRKITNFWLAINTLSFDILDGMCGFRIYPLATTFQALQSSNIGDRMDFDIEILVRLHWQKVPMIWVDTPVKYEKNGVSHFRGWQDNWLISKMHAKLFFTMLARLIQGKK